MDWSGTGYIRVYNEANQPYVRMIMTIRHMAIMGDSTESCAIAHSVIGNTRKVYGVNSFINMNTGEYVDIVMEKLSNSWALSAWNGPLIGKHDFLMDSACSETGSYSMYVSNGGGVYRSTDYGQTWGSSFSWSIGFYVLT